MKTIHKMIVPALFLTATSLFAQEKKSKVCIKLDEDKNGVITKIDTCFESSDPKEVEAFLQRMGVANDIVVSGSGGKKIIIKKEEDKNGAKNEYKYSYTTAGDSDRVIVMVNDDGTVSTSGSGDTKMMVRTFDGDDKELEKELEKEMKLMESEANKEGKNSKKEIRVIVSKKMIISDVKADEKKNMPANLQQVQGNEFEELSVFPNPSKNNFSISYRGNTSEPLTIKLYDAVGKEVLVEKEASNAKEFAKSIDVSELKKGIYFLHLSQGKKAQVKKVVITE